MATIDQTNFHLSTRGRFTRCNKPEGTPNYVSLDRKGNISSSYFYLYLGVIRISDHWGGVASCLWMIDDLDSNKYLNDCKVFNNEICAFISYEDLQNTTNQFQNAVDKSWVLKLEEMKRLGIESYNDLDRNSDFWVETQKQFKNEIKF